jgi:hypothetical protein
MAPAPPQSPLWREVKAQAIAGTFVVVAASTLAGIGYLIHRVPTQLDRVIENQTQFRGRLEVMERVVDQHGDRIVRLEATK